MMARISNKKTVSFDMSQNITFVISRSNDGSTKQNRLLWFDEGDFARMNREILLNAHRFRFGHPDCYNICTRGLEYLLKPGIFEQRKLHKDIVIQSVLQEQRRQRIVRIYSPNDIAKVSQFHSRWSSELARDLVTDTVESDSQRKCMSMKRLFVMEDHLCCKTNKKMLTGNRIADILTEAMDL